MRTKSIAFSEVSLQLHFIECVSRKEELDEHERVNRSALNETRKFSVIFLLLLISLKDSVGLRNILNVEKLSCCP